MKTKIGTMKMKIGTAIPVGRSDPKFIQAGGVMAES
jgi:hypothetical protein